MISILILIAIATKERTPLPLPHAGEVLPGMSDGGDRAAGSHGGASVIILLYIAILSQETSLCS